MLVGAVVALLRCCVARFDITGHSVDFWAFRMALNGVHERAP